MKKMILIMGVAAIASTSSAQISISWFQAAAGFQFGGSLIPSDAAHTLIWSTTPAPTNDYAFPTQGINLDPVTDLITDEWALVVSTNGTGPGIFSYEELRFTDADVGGNDINSGYLYSRIFQDSSIDEGDLYFQSPTFLGPELPVFSTDPVTTPDTDFNASSPRSGLIVMETSDADVFTVIPEPSVMALLGFGGLVLAIRRRMTLA
jgi:hypothetical protein